MGCEKLLCFNKQASDFCSQRAPGFLKLILCGSSVCVFMCVSAYVCVSAPEAINN